MRTVSPLTFDFNKLEVIVEMEGRKLTLVGSLEQGECKMINGRKLKKLIQYKEGQVSQLYSIHVVEWEGVEVEVEVEEKESQKALSLAQFILRYKLLIA